MNAIRIRVVGKVKTRGHVQSVTKEGVIARIFYNESTDVTHPVEGMVDEITQRAVWRAADGTNANLVRETGIYNLTKDQADVLVYFGPEQTQTALLVRLDESERPDSGEPVARKSDCLRER